MHVSVNQQYNTKYLVFIWLVYTTNDAAMDGMILEDPLYVNFCLKFYQWLYDPNNINLINTLSKQSDPVTTKTPANIHANTNMSSLFSSVDSCDTLPTDTASKTMHSSITTVTTTPSKIIPLAQATPKMSVLVGLNGSSNSTISRYFGNYFLWDIWYFTAPPPLRVPNYKSIFWAMTYILGRKNIS